MSAPSAPPLVVVVGTGTEVGKTWVTATLLARLRRGGTTVAARKPAQSFEPGDPPASLDAAVLARASGEDEAAVCPPWRSYPVPMAPPMAAESLGRAPFTVTDLVAECRFGPEGGATSPDLGIVETAGGLRSPQAADGDGVALCAALGPRLVVLVADAGLGTIHAVRASAAGLGGHPPLVVVLNRFDPGSELHRRNRDWLARRDGYDLLCTPGEEDALAARALRACGLG